jgi:hypothetical protein
VSHRLRLEVAAVDGTQIRSRNSSRIVNTAADWARGFEMLGLLGRGERGEFSSGAREQESWADSRETDELN